MRTSKNSRLHLPWIVVPLAAVAAACGGDPAPPASTTDAGHDVVDAPTVLRVRLLVDANRDGTVSDTGDDEAFRARWDSMYGAVFLANVDDDDDDDRLDGDDTR